MKTDKYQTIISILLFGFSSAIAISAEAQNSKEIELSKIYFNQLDSICRQDNGKLWGVNLYGATMIVIPSSRYVVANQQDKNNKLTVRNNVFMGKLPETISISNTSLNWDGENWTMVSWDAISEEDRFSRNKLFVHESWHRTQNEIGIPPVISSNSHLDNLQGSILLKLEFTILKQAYLINEKTDKVALLNDALTVRQYRQLLFPDNNENQFERHEGMAEYTGFKLCGLSSDILKKVMAKQLELSINKDGFTNSFAYISGPAYGFLFDELTSNWIAEIIAGKSLPDVGLSITGNQLINDSLILKKEVKIITNKHNAEKLIISEIEKFKIRNELNDEYKHRFSNGDQLIIPNNNINFSYNPHEALIPIDNIGVVYKTMRLVGDWGILEVSNGILRTNDWSAFIINAPKSKQDGTIIEPTYKLELKDGWRIIKIKEGKFTFRKT
jgi:hypothetical protein